MKFKEYIGTALIVVSLTGCSAVMAMTGKDTKSLNSIKVGQTRDIVTMNLGNPAKTYMTDTGRVDVFELQRGNDPSIGRALGHVGLDLLTLGWWEVVGTPVELMQGKSFELTVEYIDDKVVEVGTTEK